jgi:hypothetical protein
MTTKLAYRLFINVEWAAAVTETGTDLDKAWAQRAADALLALNEAAEAARAAGQAAIDGETRKKHEDWYRQAAATGVAINADLQGKLQKKRNALARRVKDREDDYLRFARDLRVPFTNNAADWCQRRSRLWTAAGQARTHLEAGISEEESAGNCRDRRQSASGHDGERAGARVGGPVRAEELRLPARTRLP